MTSKASAASSSEYVECTCGLSSPRPARRSTSSYSADVNVNEPMMRVWLRNSTMMSRSTTSPECAPQVDEPPVARERVETGLEELAADVLVDEIDAAAVRDPHDLGRRRRAWRG